jgi:hypothetical protein
MDDTENNLDNTTKNSDTQLKKELLEDKCFSKLMRTIMPYSNRFITHAYDLGANFEDSQRLMMQKLKDEYVSREIRKITGANYGQHVSAYDLNMIGRMHEVYRKAKKRYGL